jgi:hypothetical protein
MQRLREMNKEDYDECTMLWSVVCGSTMGPNRMIASHDNWRYTSIFQTKKIQDPLQWTVS